MPVADKASYGFLGFTFDGTTGRVCRGTSEVKLRPKSLRVLEYLLEHPRRLLSREELIQAVWENVSVTDDSLSKCIADVRNALGDDSQEIVRTVPRRGFLFDVEVERLEQPLASGSRKSATRWRMPLVAALAIVGLSMVAISIQRRTAPTYHALAVLPFESLSSGEDQQYLADGMTEEIVTSLGESSPLRIIARTSVNRYLKTRKTVREIARELGVDLVMEGTVTRFGERLRVTANLIQVSPERQIWAHSYDSDLRDVLALQTEIAAAISGEVHGKLEARESLVPRKRAVNPEAQLAYWKSRYLLENVRTGREQIFKSLEYAEQAARLDAGYAAAHAAVARAYNTLSDGGHLLPNEAMPRARAAAQRAIALDESLPLAHVALGSILLVYDWDWAGAEREARRAIALNSSDAQGHWLLSNYLAAVGRADEAVTEMRQARQLDPFAFHMNWNVGRMLCLARKYDEALSELRQAAELQRESSAVDIWKFKAYWMKGQVDDAIATDMRIRSYRDGLSPESINALRTAYGKGGFRAYWATLRKLVAGQFSTHPNGWYRLAEINTYLGDNEEALRWLTKAFPVRPNWITYLMADPTLDPVRADPRFGALLRKMGLVR